MPTCKNSSKRYFTGKEPSPKGFGYCAHAEKIGQRKKGKDGKMWIVKSVVLKSRKTRSRRWVRVPSTTKSKIAKKTKPRIRGGGNPYAGRALAGAMVKRRQKIQALKSQLADIHDQEYELKKSKQGMDANMKDVADKKLDILRQKADRLLAQLRTMNAVR